MGVKDIGRQLEFAQFLPNIFSFLQDVTDEKYEPDIELYMGAVGFACDMFTMYGQNIKLHLVSFPFLEKALAELKSFPKKEAKLQGFILWAEEIAIEISKMVNA
jgi:hypothetical protein